MIIDRQENNSLGWQLQQLKQRSGEAMEKFFSGLSFQPKKPTDLPRELPDFRWLETWRNVLFWAAVVGLVAWALWLFSPVFRDWVSKWRSRPPQEPLPEVIPNRSASLWLQQAQGQSKQGNYREACRALYFATLQGLNDRQILRHQSSRTDGEYNQAVKALNNAQAHRTILTIHEQITFRAGGVDAATYQACEQAYKEIDRSSNQNPGPKP
jgi:hypothetical protein